MFNRYYTFSHVIWHWKMIHYTSKQQKKKRMSWHCEICLTIFIRRTILGELPDMITLSGATFLPLPRCEATDVIFAALDQFLFVLCFFTWILPLHTLQDCGLASWCLLYWPSQTYSDFFQQKPIPYQMTYTSAWILQEETPSDFFCLIYLFLKKEKNNSVQVWFAHG